MDGTGTEDQKRDEKQERRLLVPRFPPRKPGDATVPTEAFDANHPDHFHWVRSTGRCYALGDHDCPLNDEPS